MNQLFTGQTDGFMIVLLPFADSVRNPLNIAWHQDCWGLHSTQDSLGLDTSRWPDKKFVLPSSQDVPQKSLTEIIPEPSGRSARIC